MSLTRSFRASLNLFVNQLCAWICTGSFSFFFSHLCLFCCILLTYIHAYPTAHPLLYPNSHECSYPNTIPIVTISLYFFSMHMLHKTSRSRSFVALFPLFFLSFLPLGPYAPIGTAFHPSAPIYIIFWQTPENMMSEEISPVIAPKSWSETSAKPHLYLIFVLLMSLAPQRTHPHPFTPIWTSFHPFVRQITYNIYGIPVI